MGERHALGLGDHAVCSQLAGGGLRGAQRVVVAALRGRRHQAHLAQDPAVDELQGSERRRGIERGDYLAVLSVEPRERQLERHLEAEPRRERHPA